MPRKFAFDAPECVEFVSIRAQFLRQILCELRAQSDVTTALDTGCGVGYFSKFLSESGFQVTALDGRKENIEEAKNRVPGVDFRVSDIEDPAISQLGYFDLVLSTGLLYHLENPFRAIRNLYALTGKILVVESMCSPGTDASMQLLDECKEGDQGLRYVAFYPSEPCLVKMLYQAGFSYVYGLSKLPDHLDFKATSWRRKARTVLVAARFELNSAWFTLYPEPKRPWDLWSIPLEPWRLWLGRAAALVRHRTNGGPPSTGKKDGSGPAADQT